MGHRPLPACCQTHALLPVVWCVALAIGMIAMNVRTTEALPGDCISLAEPFVPATADASRQPTQPSPEMKRPISEAELKALVEALEPVPLKEGEGIAIRAAAEGKSTLSPDRFGVVVGDAVTLLAMLHARESLDVLRKAKLTAEQRRTFEQDFGRVIGCGEARFANRGGAGVVKTSLDLVRRYRRELEPRLLDKLQPRRGGKEDPR